MSTKFILVGGYIQKAPDGGKAFCEEMVKGFGEPIRILDCMFAREESQWAETLEKDKELFKKNLPSKHVEIRAATKENFLAEIEWAQCIFFRGGFTPMLKEALRECPGWEKALKGKTVAGTSAGAALLSARYYEVDTNELCEGAGLVSVKYIGHFKSDYAPIDWDKAYNDLKNFKEELPIVALREGEFEVEII